MHSRAGKEPNDFFILCLKAENNNNTACLIFAKKTAGSSANHHNGSLFLVGFHMDACSVACIAFDKNLAAAHSITRCIADIAMNNNFTLVHCITHGILRVCIYDNGRSIEISTESIAGHTVNGDVLICHTGGNEALTAAFFKRNISGILSQSFV